jgi:alpha-L-rhamnosidase
MNETLVFSQAQWIWSAQQNVCDYNIAAQFRKDFIVSEHVDVAILHITADSRYRVSINGQWINDGPGKAYPEHWTYDSYDIRPMLKTGNNFIEVTARYYGVGTFHQLPQQAGLLAAIQLDNEMIGSDSSWEATPLETLRQNSPKVSVQMEPVESVDARREVEQNWQPAVALFQANDGPWQDLSARRSEALTKITCRPLQLQGVNLVQRAEQHVCVPVTRIAHPGVIEANHTTSRPVILTAILELASARSIPWDLSQWRIAIQGKFVTRNAMAAVENALNVGETYLDAGQYAVMFFCDDFYSHRKELSFPYLALAGTHWKQWGVFVREECLFKANDRHWLWFKNEAADRVKTIWQHAVQAMAQSWTSPEQVVPILGKAVAISAEELFLEDFTQDFAKRQPQPLNSANFNLEASALCVGQQGRVSVRPHEGFDFELCYDFGEQRCGYIDFFIVASAGTIIDLHMVEYIDPQGIVQHTAEFNRNGLRYICKEGANHYTSLKRRSGRYLFVTLRNLENPVNLERLQIIESTAAVRPQERFQCSDKTLNSIWDVCERTLKQTLWIGDARNEALYAFNIYGNYSVSARSLELGAQSLERFPMVGCQVPSSWDCILPAWSFLWGMHAWEHYFYSGDLEFLKQLWPAILKNLEGAQALINETGLFSAPLWNLLEWAPIDHEHATVLHNSILLAGALRAAQQCATVLKDEQAFAKLSERREHLMTAINSTWDARKNSYPDAILENGVFSDKICQHNSALAVFCGVLEAENIPAAKVNLISPPEGMTLIASPFAAQFHFEALEQLGEFEAIMSSIRHNYTPMIEAGATTAWETFPGSTCSPKGFPTRSHCHGWSCSPLQFFNRIVLGIRQMTPGGQSFEISPWVQGLEYAHGAMTSPNGLVRVAWNKRGQNLELKVTIPKGIQAKFIENKSHQAFKISWTLYEH